MLDEYTSPSAGIELTMLLTIGTFCAGIVVAAIM
jgi:hypothetical protein